MTAKKNVKNSLEQSLKRLEDIVETLERGETSLDDAVLLYEEGVQISKECAERLKDVELRIQKLSKDIDGQLSLEEPENV